MDRDPDLVRLANVPVRFGGLIPFDLAADAISMISAPDCGYTRGRTAVH
jgi:hypothetical protein